MIPDKSLLQAPEDSAFSKSSKIKLAVAAAVALLVAGARMYEVSEEQKREANETRAACASLLDAVRGMNPEGKQRESLCANKLTRDCLGGSDFCN